MTGENDPYLGRLSQFGEYAAMAGWIPYVDGYDVPERLRRSHGGLDTLCRWFADVGLHLLTVVMAGENDPYFGGAARHYACSHGGHDAFSISFYFIRIMVISIVKGYNQSEKLQRRHGAFLISFYFNNFLVISIVNGYDESERLQRSAFSISFYFIIIVGERIAKSFSRFYRHPNQGPWKDIRYCYNNLFAG
nr:hypothetical protein [Tanacetum cinerariifolium]